MPVEDTWSADAAELARTAPQAVENGTTNASCTGWRSTFVPPQTIRVLRTMGPDAGHVEQVDFRTYVLTVFGAEWQSFYPFEALKAASIAVKQYGWYYTIVYRGGVDAGGACYDVQDNTNDQYYQPELRTPTPTHERALALTWGITLRKFKSSTATGRFFLTGYRQGTSNTCGADRDGYRLYEHSVFYCAKTFKMTYVQILHKYLDPNSRDRAPRCPRHHRHVIRRHLGPRGDRRGDTAPADVRARATDRPEGRGIKRALDRRDIA